jgi:hypothetical protein
MRRSPLLAAALLLATALPTTAGASTTAGVIAVEPGDPTGLLASEGVELLGTVAQPGVIGARFRDGLMYTTGVAGVTIYDVATDPEAPAEVGTLPLPHFENEDVDLGGDILLVSNDAAESTGILYVVDVADPTAPAVRSTVQMGGNPLLGGPGHTASCVLDCAFAWVTDTGGYRVLDLRDPDAVVDLGTFPTTAARDLGIVHDVQVDAEGIVWAVGYGGTAGYRIPADADAYHALLTGPDARLGDLVTTTGDKAISRYAQHFGTGDTEYNDFIHHNSHRVAQSGTVYVTEEDYTRPGCRGAGAFQTWEAPTDVDPETGEVTLVDGGEMDLVGSWTTELLADAAAPAAVCSAHYFDVREDDGLIAQGWYEQGLRILDASDPAAIRQVGFFVPPSALTWAAYWSPTDREVLYVLDASHGIDVLRVDVAPGDAELTAPVRPQWRTGAGLDLVGTSTWGTACRLNPMAGALRR